MRKFLHARQIALQSWNPHRNAWIEFSRLLRKEHRRVSVKTRGPEYADVADRCHTCSNGAADPTDRHTKSRYPCPTIALLDSFEHLFLGETR